MSQLVPISTAGVLLDLDTGEQVALADATDEQIAVWIDRISELQSVAAERKAEAGRELIARMDGRAHWTITANGLKVSAPSPDAAEGAEWDAEGLFFALSDLGINRDAVIRAVSSKRVYTVHAAGVKALRKLGRADVDAVLDEHSTPVEKVRRVSVKRAA
jgi:hypothetical protein